MRENRRRATRLILALGAMAIAVTLAPANAAERFEGAVPVGFDQWPRVGDIREIASNRVYADIAALRGGGMPLLAWVTDSNLAALGPLGGFSGSEASLKVSANLQIAQNPPADLGGDGGASDGGRTSTPSPATDRNSSSKGGFNVFFFMVFGNEALGKLQKQQNEAKERYKSYREFVSRSAASEAESRETPGTGKTAATDEISLDYPVDITLPDGTEVTVYPDKEGTGIFILGSDGSVIRTQVEPIPDEKLPPKKAAEIPAPPAAGAPGDSKDGEKSPPKTFADDSTSLRPDGNGSGGGCSDSGCSEPGPPFDASKFPQNSGECDASGCSAGYLPSPVEADGCSYSGCGVFNVTTFGSVGGDHGAGGNTGYGGGFVNAAFTQIPSNATIVPAGLAGLSPQQLLALGIEAAEAGVPPSVTPPSGISEAVANGRAFGGAGGSSGSSSPGATVPPPSGSPISFPPPPSPPPSGSFMLGDTIMLPVGQYLLVADGGGNGFLFRQGGISLTASGGLPAASNITLNPGNNLLEFLGADTPQPVNATLSPVGFTAPTVSISGTVPPFSGTPQHNVILQGKP